MTTRIAPRMNGIAPFHVMELVARAKQLEAAGRDIIHLEVGEPDFKTAAPIIEAAQTFLTQGEVKYTPALGLPELRQAISAFYESHFGVAIAAERIIITAGASGALQLALGVLVAPGDEWLQPDPGYPCNRHFVRVFEGVPKLLPVGPETQFQPTARQIDQAWTANTRGIMLASPSNPTGTTLDPAELERIVHQVHAADGNLIVDEIYQGLTYGAKPVTALSISDDVFVVNSFSKYFGMTGWRLGWLVAPTAYLRPIEKLAQNLFICAPTVSQHAALAAFSAEALTELERRRDEFSRRRDLLLNGLRELGLGVPASPHGAFYVYADVTTWGGDSFNLAQQLLEQLGIAATPGIDFGEYRATDYMRFAYTTTQDKIAEALARLCQWRAANAHLKK
jgi:aspartate/methionine/tyrosine aminotransferase